MVVDRIEEAKGVSLSKQLTMSEAAETLGFGLDRAAARRLVYVLRRRECETGNKIIQGGGGKGKRLYVTLGTLRRDYSELVDDGHYLSVIIRETQQWVRDQLASHRHYSRQLAQRIKALEEKL